jgi:hypothetical protein
MRGAVVGGGGARRLTPEPGADEDLSRTAAPYCHGVGNRRRASHPPATRETAPVAAPARRLAVLPAWRGRARLRADAALRRARGADRGARSAGDADDVRARAAARSPRATGHADDPWVSRHGLRRPLRRRAWGSAGGARGVSRALHCCGQGAAGVPRRLAAQRPRDTAGAMHRAHRDRPDWARPRAGRCVRSGLRARGRRASRWRAWSRRAGCRAWRPGARRFSVVAWNSRLLDCDVDEVRAAAGHASEAVAAAPERYGLDARIVRRLLASYGLAPVDAYL